MSHYETVSLVVNGCGTALLLATVTVYYLQLRTMQGQLAAAQDSVKSQNLLALVGYLQDNGVRDARAQVMTVLRTKPFSDWTEADKKAASLVCSSYDVTAVIIRVGGVPAKPITENWGPSIRTCYDVLRPWIEQLQRPENLGPMYWDDFGWLYTQVAAHSTTGAPAHR